MAAPRGAATRPTADRVRQALFDMLAPRFPGARVLDVCAGTGAVGLEALSRGASSVVFVEEARAAIDVLRANRQRVGDGGGRVEVFHQDARRALPALDRRGYRFDVVFLDPPYEGDLYGPILDILGSGSLVAEGGVVVAEHFHKRPPPETIPGMTKTRAVRIGDHVLAFYARHKAASERGSP